MLIEFTKIFEIISICHLAIFQVFVRIGNNPFPRLNALFPSAKSPSIFLLMNSPPAVNDIDRIIYDAVLWQTNLLLRNVNHNVSSIHEIASVEINGERISRTLDFARHLRQKRDCRFFRFLGRKHFLPLTKLVIIIFGHGCQNLLFV